TAARTAPPCGSGTWATRCSTAGKSPGGGVDGPPAFPLKDCAGKAAARTWVHVARALLGRHRLPQRVELASVRTPAPAAQAPDCSSQTHGARPVAVLRFALLPGGYGASGKPAAEVFTRDRVRGHMGGGLGREQC